MAEAVEMWGGIYDEETGAVEVPVLAGLRRGSLAARVEVTERGFETEIEVSDVLVDYHTQWGAVVLLAIAAAAGLVGMLWPFVPALQPLLPLSLIVVVGAWLLVVARLQNRGLDELMTTIETVAEGPSERDVAPPPL